MAEFSKITRILADSPAQRLLFLLGSITLAGMLLALAPVLPQTALWRIAVPAGPAAGVRNGSAWVGHLENPDAPDAGAGGRPMTSASYTSGFNSAPVGPLPAPPSKTVMRDPNACPDDLNCTYRPHPGAATPLPRPFAVASTAPHRPPHPVRHKTVAAAEAHTAPGLSPARVLFKPFAFVADTFNGLMHKL